MGVMLTRMEGNSHRRMVPSSTPTGKRCPIGRKRYGTNRRLLCPSRVALYAPVTTSHRRIGFVPTPTGKRCPIGRKRYGYLCPSRVALWVPVTASHRRLPHREKTPFKGRLVGAGDRIPQADGAVLTPTGKRMKTLRN